MKLREERGAAEEVDGEKRGGEGTEEGRRTEERASDRGGQKGKEKDGFFGGANWRRRRKRRRVGVQGVTFTGEKGETGDVTLKEEKERDRREKEGTGAGGV